MGSHLTVRFNPDQKGRVITATAHVVYHVGKVGMGVLFTEIGLQDLGAIQEYIESVAAVPKTDPARSQSAE